MRRVVQFSGGVGSWAAAKMVAQQHGTADMVLLFADVKDEDEDLYRFLHEAAANVGAPLTVIAEGRTPREVMSDRRYIGNTRVDPCSMVLKRQLLAKWRDANCDPSTDIIYIGIDWTEINRFRDFQARSLPWRTEAPMCDQPMDKAEAMAWLAREGIQAPRLYAMGFSHNNCGGACVKAGQGQWARLLEHFPDRYASWETWEQDMRAKVGDHAILRDRRGGATKPLTLRDFRIRVESGGQFDKHDIGGCGCAIS